MSIFLFCSVRKSGQTVSMDVSSWNNNQLKYFSNIAGYSGVSNYNFFFLTLQPSLTFYFQNRCLLVDRILIGCL